MNVKLPNDANLTFRTIDGKVVNPVAHSFEMIRKHPDCKIYVGSDSQNHRRLTKYATVIAYRYGTRGAHYIYTTWKYKPKIRIIKERLIQETMVTMDVVQRLLDADVPIYAVDFDFNDEKETLSSELVSFAIGWTQGLGLRGHAKPQEMVATRAANHLANNK